MYDEFKDKACIVTGGARGIGKRIAERLTREGAQVAVIDVLPIDYDCAFKFTGDISEKNALEDFARRIKRRFGKLSFIVNNACINRGGIISGCAYESFLYVQRVGVVAPYYLASLFMNDFAENAAIVNIASTRATMSQPDSESYAAAKGGLASLTHALAASLSGKVRVNSISPGWIETDFEAVNTYADRKQQPVGRIGTPDDIAEMTLYLLSGKAGYITGENIVIDGGMTKNMIYHNDFGWEYKPG